MSTADDLTHTDPRNLETLFSRENAVQCPHFMAVLGYLGQTHGLPKYAWGEDGLIYHYTDAVGLLGIISTNRLWATNVRFLNDPSEGRHFPERILEFMRQKVGGLTPLENQIINNISSNLEAHAAANETFSVSFCREEDRLSQWRGYGSFGSGYALGFEIRNLLHPQLGKLIEVQYCFKALRAVALDILSIYVEASPHCGKYIERFCDDAAQVIIQLSLAF